jgi:hypothetical protein
MWSWLRWQQALTFGLLVPQAGDSMRSLNDLTATVQASLNQTQALQVPVLSQTAPFLVPGLSASTTFQSGELRARLAGGVLRVQRLTLVSPFVQAVIEGAATLQGRLNLEVTARTGAVGPSPLCLRLLRLRLPPVGLIRLARVWRRDLVLVEFPPRLGSTILSNPKRRGVTAGDWAVCPRQHPRGSRLAGLP